MRHATRIVFAAPRQAELQPCEVDEALGPGEFLVQTQCSLISPGTELAWFTGLQREILGDAWSYPLYPGYCNVGRVLAVGPNSRYREGDLVVCHAPHASVARSTVERPSCRVPRGLSPRQAAFARMAEIALLSLRVASLSLGDQVLVLGLGLVGNLAAQLFRLAGADVLAADFSPFRLERARRCGLPLLVNPAEQSLQEAVAAWSAGQGAHIAVDATGTAPGILQAVMLTRNLGEVVMLGTPRQSVTLNATPALLWAHQRGIVIKGAERGHHYGVLESPFTRHSSTRDLSLVMGWSQSGALQTEPLRTHLLPPSACQQAYDGLDADKEHYLGVILDWTTDRG
ncbi:MAG: zinc-binding dehydrogenase [Chloroflexi bacterium]|nr:zinc-binding dehydrogenase [Chloroflexota bacterium]